MTAMSTSERFRRAFETRDIEEFMALVFPPQWGSLASRILESGATMSGVPCIWAPRWSKIPPTVRKGKTDLHTHVKSCIFRVHDCIHQLWGLPRPDDDLNEDSFRLFKKAQMCGEVAVLTLTEFVFCRYLSDTYEELKPLLDSRNALVMLRGSMSLCTPAQVAARLDGLLHKKVRPDWVRLDPAATAFCDDYIPMLERDRREIDNNWKVMQETGWRPSPTMPNARYDARLDGLELTLWMIEDFFHLMGTGQGIDAGLMAFNRERRSLIELPPGWGVVPD